MRAALFIARTGVTPNALTVIGLIGMAIAGFLSAFGLFFLSGVVVATSCIFDALDGALARANDAVSVFGAFLDSFLDRYAEILVYAGLLVYYIDLGSTIGVGATFFAATGSLMVSYARARAEGLGVECRVGLFSRAVRIVVITAGLLTGFVIQSLLILAVATNATAARRLFYVWGVTRPKSPSPPSQ